MTSSDPLEYRAAIALCLVIVAFLLGGTSMHADDGSSGSVQCGSMLEPITSLGSTEGAACDRAISARRPLVYGAGGLGVLVGAYLVAKPARRN
jgi:hypothetical protein